MRLTVFSLAATLIASVSAAPSPSTHVLHEKRDAPLRKWVKRDAVKKEFVLPIRIGMVQSNLDRGYELLMEVSRHDSPKYSQHYTAEEVDEIFAPAEETVDAIRKWLEGAGVNSTYIKQSVNKQWMQLDIPVEKAEDLFKTKYHFFEHAVTGKHRIACDEYHVPSHLVEHIDYISPGIHLIAGPGKGKRGLEKRGFRSGTKFPTLPPVALPGGNSTITKILQGGEINFCDQFITPPCIAAMYNITPATLHHKNNQLGIFEDTDFYDAQSLVIFFSTFAQQIPVDTEPILDGIDGGIAPGVAQGESDLDFQISYPIIYPQNSVLFQTDDLHYELDYTYTGLFNNFLSAIDGSYCYSAKGLDPPYPDTTPGIGYNHKLQCGVYTPTNVISVSYGEQEDDLPAAYQKRQCAEFMKLGMRGTSIVFASGDSGVAARGADAGNADGCLGHGQIFNPDFPATCPYLTTAGAVYLPPGANVHKDEEVAVTSFPSGGGFSNIYQRPGYQNAAVEKYFQVKNPPYPYYSSTNNNSFGANGGIYNRIGRAYPDVSAIGDNVLIFLEGAPVLIGGTSASAPVFASVLNRINEERLASGKKTIGFANPVLYAHPTMFHDITVGNNSGCGTPGFYAAPGWDPVTGLGTPNYPAMLKTFMSLP